MIKIFNRLGNRENSGDEKSNFIGEIQKSNIPLSIDYYQKDDGVKAIFIINSQRIIYKFIVIGRTNYAEHGTDIVAAAISALTINTVNSLHYFTDTKLRHKETLINDLPYIELEMDKFCSDLGKEKSLVLIDSLIAGLKQVEENYGSDYLKVIEIRE